MYVSIGNSDDKLSQQQWCTFVWVVDTVIREHARVVHGYWLSESSSMWQNACWCFEVEAMSGWDLRDRLRETAGKFSQDSIAWAEVSATEFLAPA